MCKFASFVLTKECVFHSRDSNSHEDIIREHDLHEAGEGQRVNILRVEISPTKSWGDLASWDYKVDQDLLPPWADAVNDERRTRDALAEMLSGAKWPKRLDSFLASIRRIRFLKPDGKPLKAWCLSKARTWGAARAAAAGAAGGAVAGDAALMAYLVMADGRLEKSHAKHIRARWRVWQKGYALLCDVNGKLFTYAAI